MDRYSENTFFLNDCDLIHIAIYVDDIDWAVSPFEGAGVDLLFKPNSLVNVEEGPSQYWCLW